MTPRFTDARLEQFREQLLAERESTLRLMAGLGEDIRRIVDARQDSNVDDEHDPEGSTIAFERSQSDALLRQSRSRLAETDAALLRLGAPGFGVCESCGRDIPEARLEARPWATLCVDCASRA
ncbi:TraR/DksA family transcriptional regulator [Salinibacterium sp. dk2585]|uniref:TraR/DksA family transcriptional regulator n=1 Tax=unclassified Salinibacterium TaxID=2632331 RepID=UPI0011C2558A|nr:MULTISPECIES: TraR/DksA family transcriptional regulator [unclassified Salinibacterium]QEE61964.1 TraR/DksA family transcriptional regulator [Salinibacterium sp. dk2585]TXK54481.1 TraR/DksA family transcriptional regulator [Salinibacterium sp. dk5596]